MRAWTLLAVAVVAGHLGRPAEAVTINPRCFTQADAAAPAWAPGTAYATGALVKFDGLAYEAVQRHTSQLGWEPPRVPALWRIPAPCGATEWAPQTSYPQGAVVTFGGRIYRVLQPHTSLPGWDPVQAPALSTLVASCAVADTGQCSSDNDSNHVSSLFSTTLACGANNFVVKQSNAKDKASGDVATSLTISQGSATVVSVSTSLHRGDSTTTVEYGSAFTGIRRATYTSDGTTVQGNIDGRAIVPQLLDAPGALRFADGGPPPAVTVTDSVGGAIALLLAKVRTEAPAHCSPAAGTEAGGFSALAAADPCQECIDKCNEEAAKCYGGSAATCLFTGAGCLFAIKCAYSYNSCGEDCTDPGGACCAVECPGGSCCGADTSCFLKPNGFLCCPNARTCRSDKGGAVCIDPAKEKCQDGEVCPLTNTCGPDCCLPGQEACIDNTCCPIDRTCNGVCCPSGQFCGPNGQCQAPSVSNFDFGGLFQAPDAARCGDFVPNAVTGRLNCPDGFPPARQTGRVLTPEHPCGANLWTCSRLGDGSPAAVAFGGMFQQDDRLGQHVPSIDDVVNPLTKTLGCPRGYRAVRAGRVLTPETRIGGTIFACQAGPMDRPLQKIWHYGGGFQLDDCGAGSTKNPLTGGPTCPTGFAKLQVGRTTIPEGDPTCGAHQFACISTDNVPPLVFSFGGAFQRDDCHVNDLNNPATGGLSCFSDFTDGGVHGRIMTPESRCGANQTVCAKVGADPKGFQFGGMYQKADPGFPETARGTFPNPLTGRTECPDGYSPDREGARIGRVLTPEGEIGATQFLCMAPPGQTTALSRQFGGTFQIDDCGQRSLANPLTGMLECPPGYQTGQYGRVKSPEGDRCGVAQFVCFR